MQIVVLYLCFGLWQSASSFVPSLRTNGPWNLASPAAVVLDSSNLVVLRSTSTSEETPETKITITLLNGDNSSSFPLLEEAEEGDGDEEAVSAAAGDTFLVEEDEDEEDLLDDRHFRLPEHSHPGVADILSKTERTLASLHKHSRSVERRRVEQAKEAGRHHEHVYANNYVDLAKVDTIGFDFDYTLVTYTEELLELIYDMALKRLVHDKQYPEEMLTAGLRYDPFFSIRGLAVDRETGWITHLSYTHKVAVAWEGREKLPTSRIYEEYRGKRALRPSERRKRLKPLNDLFSMAECCLIADTIQFFKDGNIAYCPQSAVTDVLGAIGETHTSGAFHNFITREDNMGRFFEPTPYLGEVLRNLKAANKRLILASNSPFWYVDAGMRYALGDDWRDLWDTVLTSAGKPAFYTDEKRPFREICLETGHVLFNKVESLEKGRVYTQGCLKELTRLVDFQTANSEGDIMSNVLYIGDSLFADLVDAKREFGWTTAAVTPEVGYEMEIHGQAEFALSQRTIELLLNALRHIQDELGTSLRTVEDARVLDAVEKLVSRWRDRETRQLGNPFGSIFRARYQPSLFAHSLRRYCDLYMPSVSSLRHYSPDHRFYPEVAHRLLAHEMSSTCRRIRPGHVE